MTNKTTSAIDLVERVAAIADRDEAAARVGVDTMTIGERATVREAADTITRLQAALERIAEGNLGDQPWQADYVRIREVAREALRSSVGGGVTP